MGLRICMIGCRWFLDDLPPDEPFDVQLRRAGGNTGNLLIGEAVRRHLRRLVPDLERLDHLPMEHLRTTDGATLGGRYDLIVMAAANMLKPGVNFGFVARFAERSGLPLVILGLGAQAEHLSDAPDLHPGTLRLVAHAARTGAVGVRGSFTADLLARHGIGGVTVTGCPSGYLATRALVPPGEVRRAVLSFKRDRGTYAADAALRPVQQAMLRLAMQRGFDYVAQANFAELWMGHHGGLDPHKLANMVRYFGIEDRVALGGYVRDHVRSFFRWLPWQDLLDGADFAFGARFHGNMMALIAGVPALAITHDTRTAELCETHGLPSIGVGALDVDLRLDRLVEAADFSAFNRAQPARIAAFDTFVTRALGLA